MPTFHRFEDIDAWQRARELTRALYAACADEKKLREDATFCTQITRASVLAMSRIADGFARRNTRDFLHALDIACCALAEVQSMLYVALDAGYIHADRFELLYGMAEDTAAHITAFGGYLRRFT